MRAGVLRKSASLLVVTWFRVTVTVRVKPLLIEYIKTITDVGVDFLCSDRAVVRETMAERTLLLDMIDNEERDFSISHR